MSYKSATPMKLKEGLLLGSKEKKVLKINPAKNGNE